MISGLMLGDASTAGTSARPDRPHVKPARTGLAYDPLFLEHWLEPGHPESPQRFSRIMESLAQHGLLQKTIGIKPLDQVEPQVLHIHTDAHLASVRRRYGHSHKVAMTAAAAGVAAIDAVCKGRLDNAFCVTRPPGHHALNTGKERGFCFYNTVAIAARHAQVAYGLERILIVDWDYHHGNGTEAAFYEDPSVLFFSTHDHRAYPGTGDPRRRGAGKGEGYNVNVHLDCGADDRDILTAFDRYLLPTLKSFSPDLVVVSAGFDSRKDDTLGCFDITDDGFVALTKMVMDIADRHCKGRLVSVLEGGYNLPGLAKSATVHVKTLTGA